jgi:hypothetical protein
MDFARSLRVVVPPTTPATTGNLWNASTAQITDQ